MNPPRLRECPRCGQPYEGCVCDDCDDDAQDEREWREDDRDYD